MALLGIGNIGGINPLAGGGNILGGVNPLEQLLQSLSGGCSGCGCDGGGCCGGGCSGGCSGHAQSAYDRSAGLLQGHGAF